MLIATIAFAILVAILALTIAACDNDDVMAVLIIAVAIAVTIIALYIKGGQ